MELPRGNLNGDVAVQATAQWADPDAIERVGYSQGDIWFGYTYTENAMPFGYSDDRHIVTIAGNRAGKGTSSIIPNLCEHHGSLICIDPKGENASVTASRRGRGSDYAEGMGQNVCVLDPFKIAHVEDDQRGYFNPLDCIDIECPEAVDDAAAIAESLVVVTSDKDAHWDESARGFIEALILFVVITEPKERRHLPRVRELLMLGDREGAKEAQGDGTRLDPFLFLLGRMEQCEEFSNIIAGAAATLLGTGDNEQGSILSTARRNTKFIDSPGMRDVLSRSNFSLDDLKNSPRGLSLYLCLPARRLETHGRWLRTMVMLALGHMERMGNRPATGYPVLFLLDEFATLGHVPSLEKAAGFIAGYGVKLWIILQDLNQLKANYKDRWETFLGNAGVLQFFGNADMTTLEYVSKRLGETEFRQETIGSSTPDSESTSTSSSDSWSSSESHSNSVSTSLKYFFDIFGGYVTGNSKSVSTSSSQTHGTTSGTTHGRNTGISRNESIVVAPLMRPDEIAKYFGRGTGRQILFIAGAPPIVLGQTIYFQDQYFLGKFDPHPDHLDTIPPTLAHLKAERLALEDANKKAEEEALRQLKKEQRRLRRKQFIKAGAVTAIGVAVFTMIQINSREVIPLNQTGFRIKQINLRPVNGGHIVQIKFNLWNKSLETMRAVQIGWNGKYCLKLRPNEKFPRCTAFKMPKSDLKTKIKSRTERQISTEVGPILGLRGNVTVNGKIIEATN